MTAQAALKAELIQDLRADRFDVTEDGLYFPRQSVLASGEYFDRVNGQGAWARKPNRIVKEGLVHILNVALGTTPKPAGYYLALSSGSTTPADSWTAANYAAVAGEIVSMTEGHTGAMRPAWTPNASASASIDNMAAVASLTIATSGVLNVTGAALLTNNVRGGTSGVLISASLYAAPRTFQSGDMYELGYRINLTV